MAKKATNGTGQRAGRSRAQLMAALRAAFRKEFPDDTVDVSDGFGENIHVLVVSRRFDTMEEDQRQECLWSIIDGAGLSKSEISLISLVMPVSPAQIK